MNTATTYPAHVVDNTVRLIGWGGDVHITGADRGDALAKASTWIGQQIVAGKAPAPATAEGPDVIWIAPDMPAVADVGSDGDEPETAAAPEADAVL